MESTKEKTYEPVEQTEQKSHSYDDYCWDPKKARKTEFCPAYDPDYKK